MRNVTITLDEETATWARLEAARRDTSVSHLVGEILRQETKRDIEYEAAREQFLATRPVPLTSAGEQYPTRNETHDRARLR